MPTPQHGPPYSQGYIEVTVHQPLTQHSWEDGKYTSYEIKLEVRWSFFSFVFSFKLDLWNCKIWLQCSVNQSVSTTILLSVSGVSKLVSYSVSESISQWVNQWVRQVGGCQSVSRSTWEDTEPITNTRAWVFSGFFLISWFFRAQKILKSIQIMQSFHILNKNIVKIVPWS